MTAPIEGVVTHLPVKEGEVTVIGTMNNAGTQLMTISDMATVEAVMMVDETSVPQVKVGQKAILSIDAYPNRKFDGTVTEVGSSPIPKNDPDLLALTANSEAINFKVKIQIDEPAGHDPPGLLGHGRHRHRPRATARRRSRSRRSSSATSPRRARRPRPAAPRPRRASTRSRTASSPSTKVETGIAGELMIEVKKGPAVGQEIVTGPFKVLRQIKEGDKVIIEKEGGTKQGRAEEGA